MVSVSFVNNAAALAILQSSERNPSATDFLSSSVVSASSNDALLAVFDAFAASKEFQKQFTAEFRKWMEKAAPDGTRIHPDNAKHNALTDVIIKNREAFPPEQFSIRTELPNGASIETTIPSKAAMMGDIFKGNVAERHSAYDAELAEANAFPDPEPVKLQAMAQIVRTLALDKQSPEEGRAAVEMLRETSKPWEEYKRERT